jgi:hypothetical protein
VCAVREDWGQPEVSEDSGILAGELEGPDDDEELGPEESYPDFEVPQISGEDCLIARPGEDFEVLASMPKRFHEPRALVLWRGELIAVHGRSRDRVRTPGATDVVDPSEPVATRIVLVTIRQRSRPPRTWPLRYLVLTNAMGELLGWLDHSPPSWDFQVSQIKAIGGLARMECETEVYDTEAEFAQAHPPWSN